MGKKIIIILLLANCLSFCNFCAGEKELIISEKNCIVLVNGEPSYFNLEKKAEFHVTKEWIKKNKGQILKAGKINFYEDLNENILKMYTYHIQDDPYEPLLEVKQTKESFSSEPIRDLYFYKVMKNRAYVSKDGINWDRLYISIVNDEIRETSSEKIYITFCLKCKWFEGEYNNEEEMY